MTARKTHSALLALLKGKENHGEMVTVDGILGVTGWKRQDHFLVRAEAAR